MHNEEKPIPNTQGRKGEYKREPLSPKGRRLKTTKMGAEKNEANPVKKKEESGELQREGKGREVNHPERDEALVAASRS